MYQWKEYLSFLFLHCLYFSEWKLLADSQNEMKAPSTFSCGHELCVRSIGTNVRVKALLLLWVACLKILTVLFTKHVKVSQRSWLWCTMALMWNVCSLMDMYNTINEGYRYWVDLLCRQLLWIFKNIVLWNLWFIHIYIIVIILLKN